MALHIPQPMIAVAQSDNAPTHASTNVVETRAVVGVANLTGNPADDASLIDATQTPLSASTKTVHGTISPHALAASHDAFTGPIPGQLSDLAVDPTLYVQHAADHTRGALGGLSAAFLAGDHEILDLTSLTGNSATGKSSGVNVFNVGSHPTDLKLSLVDVLNGEPDFFIHDGTQQVVPNGPAADTLDLSKVHFADLASDARQEHGTPAVGGVEYNVFDHSGAHTDLLMQQGMQIVLHH